MGINWQLRLPHRTQASGQVKKMNHLIKSQIVKLGQESGLSWPQLLPLALLRTRMKLRAKEGLSPFKTLYKGPDVVQTGISTQLESEIITEHAISLQE